MAPDFGEVKKIIDAALDQPPAERQAFVNHACGDDAALKESVQALLNDDSLPEEFLEPPVKGAAHRLLHDGAEHLDAGASLGGYRIIELIASGGIGTVYRAQSAADPSGPEVAVKVIKRGMASDDILRRFRQERQMLAALRHEHIAHFIDSGTTENNLPYLVMEYIEGKPIDQYCDHGRLALADRLRLFGDVCSAVQYSHRNLVVHRDLKPGNILVTKDGTPKLLDFGIAKLLEDGSSAHAAEPTITMHRLVTPQYASPEQIAGEPITTASDVYSLGVILYELLTGHRPYELTGQPRQEIQKLLGEFEPQPPSTRVMRSTEIARPDGTTDVITPELVSKARDTSPQKLRRDLAGDLDTIVLRAMHKDPTRRYASVEQLADDIRRYLTGLPVLARPDTFRYRAGKFIRRNKAAVAAVAIAAISLAGGAIGTSIGLARASSALQIAEAETETARIEAQKADRISEFLQGMLAAADPTNERKDLTVRELLDMTSTRLKDELDEEPQVKALIHQTIGTTYMCVGVFDSAETHLREATRLFRDISGSESGHLSVALRKLGECLDLSGHPRQAEESLREALRIQEDRLGRRHDQFAHTLDALGSVLQSQGKYEEADDAFMEALETFRKLRGNKNQIVARLLDHLSGLQEDLGNYAAAETLQLEAYSIQTEILDKEDDAITTSLHNLGILNAQKGDYQEAEKYLKRALERTVSTFGMKHPKTANSITSLGQIAEERGDYTSAESMLRKGLELRREILGNEHPKVAHSLKYLGSLLCTIGNYEEAEPLLAEAYEIYRTTYGDGHVAVAGVLGMQGFLYGERGDLEAAERVYREALSITVDNFGDEHPRVAAFTINLAGVLYEKGELQQAEVLCRRALELDRKLWGDSHPEVAADLNTLAILLSEKGDLVEAARLHRNALEINRNSLGERHPNTAKSLYNLGGVLVELGRTDEAERVYNEALTIRREILPQDHPDLARTLRDLARVLIETDDMQSAELLAREYSRHLEGSYPQDSWRVAHAKSLLGTCLAGLKRFEEGEPLLVEGYLGMKEKRGEENEHTLNALREVVDLYDSWGKPEKAAEYRALLPKEDVDDEARAHQPPAKTDSPADAQDKGAAASPGEKVKGDDETKAGSEDQGED